jgi:hypothetical protein
MEPMRRGLALVVFAFGCGGSTAGGPRPASVPVAVSAYAAQLDWMPLPERGWTIYGYVLDRESRQPLAGAAVIATDAASGRSRRVTTNGLGQFAFGRMAAGRYQVAVNIGKARDVWPDVVLDAGKRTALRFHIGQSRKIDLDDRPSVRRVNRR